MSTIRTVELAGDARDEFLGTGGTGVLSFADAENAPYSVPVSYGYDATDGTVYFRLGFVGDGRKAELVEDERPVSFVTYDDTADRWHSVVATGTLDEITEPAVGSDAMAGLERVDIPLVDAFERDPEAVQFRFFRLDADSVTGRREAASER
jgi:nitroimidazol reductase NimA-like FMN-containing flavoprotein (pyridoxamine 5'-phosphate oxidase superfamily)